MATNHIRIGQLNLGGSALATKELPALAKELRLDVVLVQEHHSQAQRGGPTMIEFGSAPKAAVFIARRDLRVLAMHHLSTAHCAVAAVSVGSGRDVYVVSSYFQYSDDIEPHLLQLEQVLERLRGKNVVAGLDANAHSPMWFSQPHHYIGRGARAEQRRQHMEDFIYSRDVVLHNRVGQPSTFSGPNGESNIDLTLGTRSVAVEDWTVHDGVSSSDHRLITFSVACGRVSRAAGCAGSKGGEPPRFRGTGVDWARFRDSVSERMGNLNGRKSASELARDFTDAVVRSAYECLGTARRRKDVGYEWWSAELDAMRKKVARLRCAWQSKRNRGGLCEDNARAEFHAGRRAYRRLMEEAQNEYHVREAESGNTDPWGQAYRVASGRFHPPANVLNGVKYLEGHAESVDDAADSLLYALCPDDDPSKDTAYHGLVRVASTFTPSTCSAPPPGPEVLRGIVRRLPNTAPGLDGITARMVKEVWTAASVEFHSVYAKCVTEGVFPDVWKEGRLVVLPKSNDKPLTDPKAYRPITLLPIFGKILERVLLACAPQILREISDCQHGFTVGRSTVTALQAMLSTAVQTSSKNVVALFLDISGAFDNAWWPMILLKVKQRGCPQNLFRLLASYFVNRRVGLFVGGRVRWKASTMGCPQGSVLGPALWNVLLDDLLRLPLPGGVKVLAYADDVTVLIEANTRRAIEIAAANTIRQFEDWGCRNRLEFAPAKTQMVALRGKLGSRPPVIKLGSCSVKFVAEAVVLGVTIDGSRSFAPHARSIGERAAKCFGKMSRVSTASWGIRYRALRILYQGTFVATITYAAACWAERATLYVVRSLLLKAQRGPLILLSKAYRTTSTSALAVLAGVLPADLEVIRAGRIDLARKSATERELSSRKREIRSVVGDLWQERWASDERGSHLRRFFPTVAGRLKATWVSPDYETSQLLTGHGCFRWRLHGFRLCDSSECECGEGDEDAHHVLWVCKLYEDLRCKMMDGLVRTEAGPVYYLDLVASEVNFRGLREFAHAWHRRRNGPDTGPRPRRRRRGEEEEEEEDEEEEEYEEEEEDDEEVHARRSRRNRRARRGDWESRVVVLSAPERGEGALGTRRQK